MARTRYVVEPLGSTRWKITVDKQEHGPYASPDEALAAAIDAAHKEARRQKTGTQVFSKRKDGKLHLEWTSGEDPYPPPRLKTK